MMLHDQAVLASPEPGTIVETTTKLSREQLLAQLELRLPISPTYRVRLIEQQPTPAELESYANSYILMGETLYYIERGQTEFRPTSEPSTNRWREKFADLGLSSENPEITLTADQVQATMNKRIYPADTMSYLLVSPEGKLLGDTIQESDARDLGKNNQLWLDSMVRDTLIFPDDWGIAALKTQLKLDLERSSSDEERETLNTKARQKFKEILEQRMGPELPRTLEYFYRQSFESGVVQNLLPSIQEEGCLLTAIKPRTGNNICLSQKNGQFYLTATNLVTYQNFNDMDNPIKTTIDGSIQTKYHLQSDKITLKSVRITEPKKSSTLSRLLTSQASSISAASISGGRSRTDSTDSKSRAAQGMKTAASPSAIRRKSNAAIALKIIFGTLAVIAAVATIAATIAITCGAAAALIPFVAVAAHAAVGSLGIGVAGAATMVAGGGGLVTGLAAASASAAGKRTLVTTEQKDETPSAPRLPSDQTSVSAISGPHYPAAAPAIVTFRDTMQRVGESKPEPRDPFAPRLGGVCASPQ